MTIIYPVPEIIPDPRARFIQIVNTCYAFATIGIKVILIAGIKKGYSKEKVLEFYGLPKHPNLSVIGLPMIRSEKTRRIRFSWHGLFYFSLLVYLLFIKIHEEQQMIMFLRYIKLAGFILKFKIVLKFPIVFEVHEIFNLSISNEKKKDKIRRLENVVYKRADVIISISQTIKRYLIDMGIPGKSVYVIQNGIKQEWFDVMKRASGSYICYTGSFYDWKGVDILIKAMAHLPDEKLLIVGGGDRLEELRKLTKTEKVLERVVFTGPVQHAAIPGYLSQAKVVVLPNILFGPSLFSSPLKLFEYMACGIPIVASDMPVLREILVDGENAILFEPGNPEALASGIKKITDNPELAKKIVSRAREEARDYTYEKRAERILEMVSRLSVPK
jgi:glycosyltransferase involved in cell wall biosynthesis